METRTVKCPYDGHWYHAIPGLRTWEKPLLCPVCGAKQVPDGGINDGTAGTKDAWPHQEIERTFLTDEEAIAIFKKYAKKQYPKSYNAGRELFEDAWHMPYWNNGDYGYKRKDWMGDDLVLAFDWYLDSHGRSGNYIEMPKGTKTRKELESIEKDIDKMISDIQTKKYNQQYESRKRREAKLEVEGKEMADSLNIGDVVIVKFNSAWNCRPLQVLEIDNGSIAGFYLDREDQIVIADAPEKEGYVYTKPSKYTWVKVDGEYVDGKFEWDGKTMKKTRSYVTKDMKFIKSKVENPVIKK